MLELEERTGREVSQPAVFIALRRLEDKGLLHSRMDDHAVEETWDACAVISDSTPRGVRRLRDSRRALVRLWEGIATELDRA